MKRALVVLALLAACSHQVSLEIQAPATLPDEPPGSEIATVTRVVDGDTIEVRVTGRDEGPGAGDAEIGSVQRVRLIGIDTPESVDPRRPVECFGKEASAATRALLAEASVHLVKDVEEADAYDRLLRYVYLGQEMANARLVVNGYASAYTYPPNVRHSEMFVQLEGEAREKERGLWSRDSCGSRP